MNVFAAARLDNAYRRLWWGCMNKAVFDQVIRERPEGWLGGTYGLTIGVVRWSVQKGKCFYCDKPLRIKPWRRNRGDGWTRDHVVPTVRGGPNGGENIVLACRACNQRKGDRRPEKHETKTAHANWQKVRRFGL